MTVDESGMRRVLYLYLLRLLISLSNRTAQDEVPQVINAARQDLRRKVLQLIQFTAQFLKMSELAAEVAGLYQSTPDLIKTLQYDLGIVLDEAKEDLASLEVGAIEIGENNSVIQV